MMPTPLPSNIKQALSTIVNNPQREELPSLSAQGTNIVRNDTKQPVQLKGITSNAFRYPGLYSPSTAEETINMSDLINRLSIVKGWGINTVNFYLDPSLTQKNISSLDTVVDWAQKNGMYVILNPIFSGSRGNKEYPMENVDKEFFNLMPSLAARYSGKKHIIYGTIAEPASPDPDVLYPQINKLANNIRKVNPDAMVVIPGTLWSRSFDYLGEHPLNISNAIYDVHDYPYGGVDEAQASPNTPTWAVDTRPLQGKYPVMQGEFGGVWTEPFGTPEDTNYIKKVLNEANKTKSSALGYAIDEVGNLSLLTPQNTLTSRGKVWKEDLAKYPPTVFKQNDVQKLKPTFTEPFTAGYSSTIR